MHIFGLTPKKAYLLCEIRQNFQPETFRHSKTLAIGLADTLALSESAVAMPIVITFPLLGQIKIYIFTTY